MMWRLQYRSDSRLHAARKKTARRHRPKFFIDPTSGVRRPMTPTLSLWWLLYIQDPQPECKHWSKTFRQRFRLPYHSFLSLLDRMNQDDVLLQYFRRWKPAQAEGDSALKMIKRKVSPMELLLLGALRYLGRGWTFDDLEESTFIARDVHRCFFHKFIEFGAKVLYPAHVSVPLTLNDLQSCEHEYRMAGFPGCIGSTDATHIPLENVSYGIRQCHLGYKMKTTTRTYNLTVNHRRQILHSTFGHPGRWNDKTLIRFDSFMTDLHNGSLNSTMEFDLLIPPMPLNSSRNEDGAAEEAAAAASTHGCVTMKGAYVIVDNGYLDWSTTIPPLKESFNRAEIRFSQWLESLRKDVECTFGILKGRWRILKTGIRLHNTEVADRIWLTCCALHNLLLDVDGLSSGWQNGIRSHWEGASGEFETDEIPDSIRRLIHPDSIRTYDKSSCGYNANVVPIWRHSYNNNHDAMVTEGQQQDIVLLNSGEGIAVNEIPMKQFRAMLIENFNILFHKEEIKWPKRLIDYVPRNVPVVVGG